MTGKLRLGPLPKTETVKLTIALSAALKADLDRYAEIHSATYGGELVDAAALIPHMLAAFIERDRGFRKALQAPPSGQTPTSRSPSISAAKSSTRDTASEGSASA